VTVVYHSQAVVAGIHPAYRDDFSTISKWGGLAFKHKPISNSFS
jgi:hypothetical protein